MPNEHVATYLNDHLAGSVAALELLEHIESAHAGTPLERFAAELRADVEADREELVKLMERLQVAESRTRKATAWLAEKVTEFKLRVDDPSDGALRLLETLDAVGIGIDGKRALWLALAASAEDAPWLRIADYDRLTARAEDQRNRVEVVRLAAAKKALGSAS
jgi:hypothetical protein